jgi:hypothetical protein
MVSIGKWLIYGLVGAFAISALVDPARAQGTIGAFSGVGTALGSLGSGLLSLGSGIGTGTAKLFNPLFTLRDLIYGPQAGQQTEKDLQESTSLGQIMSTPQYTQTIKQTETTTGTFDPQGGFSYGTRLLDPGAGPVAPAVVHGQTVPLTAEAIAYYQTLGVTVSPGKSENYNAAGVTVSPTNNETVASNNAGNATGVSSASSSYQAGAAQAMGYSTGSPRHA